MTASVIYALCAVASIAVALLLARGFLQSRAPLLAWSAAGFAGLAANNVVLFVDKVVVTDVDLSLVRGVTALAGVAILLFGLIWEAR